MKHNKELFKRNRHKNFLIFSLYTSLLTCRQIITTTSRARLIKSNFNHFFKIKLNKTSFSKILFKNNDFKCIKSLRIIKMCKRNSDCTSMSIVQLSN